MQTNLSLKNRIVIAFTIQTIIIAAIVFLMLSVYVRYIEKELLYEHLSKDLDAYVTDLDNNKTPLLSEDVKIFRADHKRIPDFSKNLGLGAHEVVLDNGFSYHVLNKTINGIKYTLIKDQTEFEKIEAKISRYTLIILTLFVFISFFFSRSLADKIIRPVVDLASKVSRLNTDNFNHIVLDYPDDEIGTLVKVVYEHVNTINLYLQREKWFTGDISHELRTPMMIISSSMDLLKLNTMNLEQQNRIYQRIEDAVSSVNELINTFLLLARESQSDVSENISCDVSELTHTVINNLKPYVQNKPIKFTVLNESKTLFSVSSGMVSIVLTNLIKNAILNTESGAISVIVKSNGFTLSDTGKGLSINIKHYINKEGIAAFKKSDNQGLGLSIVKRVCEREKWSIVAYDCDNAGACFTIDFGL